MSRSSAVAFALSCSRLIGFSVVVRRARLFGFWVGVGCFCSCWSLSCFVGGSSPFFLNNKKSDHFIVR
ncbi:MAG: hypothetical protein ACRC80_23660 [Waterburya sp.]